MTDNNVANDLLKKARKQYADEIKMMQFGCRTAVMTSLEEIFGKENLMPHPIETWDDIRKLKVHDQIEVVIGPEFDRCTKNSTIGKQALALLKLMQLMPFYNTGVDEWSWNDVSDKFVIEYNTKTHQYEVLKANGEYYNPFAFKDKESAEKFVKKNHNLLDDYLEVTSQYDYEDD